MGPHFSWACEHPPEPPGAGGVRSNIVWPTSFKKENDFTGAVFPKVKPSDPTVHTAPPKKKESI